ncbi:MAG: methionine gamma-lyase family protein, partial [Schwartzia sp.]|nr:methionine gamma-lyase family protein [Schwartzia sp. (in: firmicutes)]
MPFSEKLETLKEAVLQKYRSSFRAIEEIAEDNTLKILDAMRALRVSEAYFHTTSGYAYDDLGRQKLDELFAQVFGAESALVRTQFVSGTHALATVLFGVLRPGDRLLSVTGAPYDTMQTVIGYANPSSGSLKEFGILYDELPLVDGRVDIDGVEK